MSAVRLSCDRENEERRIVEKVDNPGGDAFVIRFLEPDEWPAYKRLRLEALEREPQAFGSPYAEAAQKPDDYWRKRLEKARATRGSWMWFAVRHGVPVGMAAAYTEATGCVEIVSVYVTPNERKRGIARALVETVLRGIQSRRAGVAVTAALHVNTEQKAAIRLYTSLGFTIIGEAGSVLGDGKEHTEYRMEKTVP